jgi:hypothetical protein
LLPHNATVQLQAAFKKAARSAPVVLHFKAIKGDGYLRHRA